eukprot:GHRR01036875.1.p1 GENE.GHRR01036875.1~~GHRR01036875.1.p1  ORF type:complete len:212 (+),score=37.46 GHRR01036875.1:295-930(+)
MQMAVCSSRAAQSCITPLCNGRSCWLPLPIRALSCSNSTACQRVHSVRVLAQVNRWLLTCCTELTRRRLYAKYSICLQAVAGAGGGHAGHAKLHDFCMTIPYGGIALLSGVVAALFKAQTMGLQLLGAGVVICLSSVFSLRTWKAGGRSTLYTLVSAGTSGWVAYQMWQRVQASVAPVPSGILLALSAALAAFCLYNIVAGGNPPPQKHST